MSKRRQRDFFESDNEFKPGRHAHGGDMAKGRRKLIRPLDPRRPVHITMRSTKAKGRLSFRNHQVTVKRVIDRSAARNNVTLHKFANVGNHLHMLVSFKRRESMQRFMREVTGIIARVVTGARKGKPFGKFWDALAFSRVVTGLRDFATVANYVFLNQIEGEFGSAARKYMDRFERAGGDLSKLHPG